MEQPVGEGKSFARWFSFFRAVLFLENSRDYRRALREKFCFQIFATTQSTMKRRYFISVDHLDFIESLSIFLKDRH